MKKTTALILALSLIALSLAGCTAKISSSSAPAAPAPAPAASGSAEPAPAPAPAGPDVELLIPTSNLTGTWYIWGSALSKVINEKVPGYTASPEVTDGPLANLQMLENDEVLLTLGNGAVCYEAWMGEGIASPDGKKFQKQRSLVMAYPSLFHNITTTQTGVENITDLEGKIVAVAPVGSGPNYSIEYSMEALGITPKDKIPGGVDAAYELLKDNNIANVVLAMGIPVGTVTDFALNYDMRFVEYTQEQIDIVNGKYPFLKPGVIPAGTYNKQDHDILTLTFGNMIICHEDMDEDLAYKICEAVLSSKPDFVNAHSSGNDLEEAAFVQCTIPLHPGAVKYYKDKGYDIPEELIPAEYKG